MKKVIENLFFNTEFACLIFKHIFLSSVTIFLLSLLKLLILLLNELVIAS